MRSRRHWPQRPVPWALALAGGIGVLLFASRRAGLTMIAFIQEQVVNQLHWLTPRELVDGLALGQFTSGPILMVAAYV